MTLDIHTMNTSHIYIYIYIHRQEELSNAMGAALSHGLEDLPALTAAENTQIQSLAELGLDLQTLQETLV